MEDCEIGVLTETGCGAKERDQKSQSHRALRSDLHMVCILHYSWSEKREGTRVLEEITRWRN